MCTAFELISMQSVQGISLVPMIGCGGKPGVMARNMLLPSCAPSVAHSLLQRLNVQGTVCVSGRERIMEQLQQALPNCQISS